MILEITEKWAKEIALMSDAEFEENCKHIETLLNNRKKAMQPPRMTIEQAITILNYHKAWRRGAEVEMTDPKQLGIAIDVIIEYFRLNP